MSRLFVREKQGAYYCSANLPGTQTKSVAIYGVDLERFSSGLIEFLRDLNKKYEVGFSGSVDAAVQETISNVVAIHNLGVDCLNGVRQEREILRLSEMASSLGFGFQST